MQITYFFKYVVQCAKTFQINNTTILGEHLTLSVLTVINVKIPLQPHKKYDITQYGELDFS